MSRARRILKADRHARRFAGAESLEPRYVLNAQIPDNARYIPAEEGALGAPSRGGASQRAAPYPLAQTFLLHSNPGSTRRVYLDFNGHVTTGTNWNLDFTVNSINTPAFDTNNQPATFSNLELEQIQEIWQRVSEDYYPFDVDVTTEDPGVEALRKTSAADNEYGMRMVIGGDGAWVGLQIGGIAYLNSFDGAVDVCAFVFPDNLLSSKSVAEATSHEGGHTFGLAHDGKSTPPAVEYYAGHGTGATGWAPIMGVGYNRQLVQWSKGEYAGANNLQDDLSIITTQNGFGYRPDDHGDTVDAGTYVTRNGVNISAQGFIGQTTDVDVFRFVTSGGSASVTVNSGALPDSNLDVLLELYNAAGQLVGSSNPADALSASLALSLAPGAYSLHIRGTGKGDPLGTGYTNYASLGQYFITGVVPPPPEIFGTVFDDVDEDGVHDLAEGVLAGWTVYIDTNNDGIHQPGELSAVTSATGYYEFQGLANGTYVVRQIVQGGYHQTLPAAGAGQTVTVTGNPNPPPTDFGDALNPQISGTVWLDGNKNGVIESTEARLANWVVYVDTNNNGLNDPGEPSALSDVTGAYTITNLGVGTHVVREEIMPNWELVSPASQFHTVTFTSASQDAANINFGNFREVNTFDGVVYHDVNGNGGQDANEPGLANFIVYIDRDDNGQIGLGEPQAVTGNDGRFRIRNVEPGAYRVRQVLQPAWQITAPASASYFVTLAPLSIVQNLNFGNTPAFDYGDAPLPFLTLKGQNGAVHRIQSEYRLGASIGSEADGTPSTNAENDADDDGVVFTSAPAAGKAASVEVTVSKHGFLNAWVDFNNDGFWSSGEQIFQDTPVSAGLNALSYSVPNSLNAGALIARFRYGVEQGLGITGLAIAGEVEDYSITAALAATAVSTFTSPPGASGSTSGGSGSGGSGGSISGTSSTSSSGSSGGVAGTATAGKAFQNSANPLDVNGDGRVTNIDAILVASPLRSAGGPYVLPSTRAAGQYFTDVTGDGRITNLDVIMIASHLRSAPTTSSAPTGEGVGFEEPASSAEKHTELTATFVAELPRPAAAASLTTEAKVDRALADLADDELPLAAVVAPRKSLVESFDLDVSLTDLDDELAGDVIGGWMQPIAAGAEDGE